MVSISSGESVNLLVSFGVPGESVGPLQGYVCKYEIGQIGLVGSALGADPLAAVRFAIFQVRIKLVHRYPDLRLVQANGDIVPLDYEEPA